ncbi:DUF6069 family protein [Haladaptatus pallidirubidus]|uniref:DUF6069 family protein n=1 Tax=Haladaptatus pallidirubidus TaxID=1008152 RepID=UPI0035E7F251
MSCSITSNLIVYYYSYCTVEHGIHDHHEQLGIEQIRRHVPTRKIRPLSVAHREHREHPRPVHRAAIVEFPAEFVGGAFGPLAVGPVVVNSAVAAIGATLVYGVVTRYAARPNRTFTIIAGAALVLSFTTFLAPDLSGAPPRVFAILAVMHVTAAVTIVAVLTQATNQEAES